MDSQAPQFIESQNTTSDPEVIINDSVVTQSAYLPQFLTQSSQIPSSPFSYAPLNAPFHQNFPFNPLTSPYPSHVQQPYGFSYEGILNSSIPMFDSSPSLPCKGAKKKEKKKKLPNCSQTTQPPVPRRFWTTEEDVALTRAYLYISVGPVIGKDQTSESMWNRIFKTWRDNMGAYDETRNANALSCRWGSIQAVVNKFNAIYESLEREPQSGVSVEDIKREAFRMYKELGDGSSFKYEHCWEIMKGNPKWCSDQLTKSNSSKRQKSGSTSAPTPTTETHSDLDYNTSAAGNLNEDGVVRPPGRKCSKEKRKREVEEKSVVNVLSNLQVTLEKQYVLNQEGLNLKIEHEKKEYDLQENALKRDLDLKEKAQKMKEDAEKRKEKAQIRKDQERIMNTKLADLPPYMVDIYEKLKEKIMKEWDKDSICPRQ